MFSIKFDKYLKERNCSAKTISAMTNISEPTISRYRKGKTVPSIENGNIESIASALAELPGGTSNKEEIYEDLLVAAYEDLELVDYKVYSHKLSSLINALDINKSKLADTINISSSYLSKICNGQVKPRNPVYIAESIADYVSENFDEEDQRKIVHDLITVSNNEDSCFPSTSEYNHSLKKWLLIGESAKSILVENLLYKYGDFDLNKYLSYPKNAATLHSMHEFMMQNNETQTFTGVDGLEKAFFTWVDIACNSKVNDEIFLFDEVYTHIARTNFKTAYNYVAAVEKMIQNGKKISLVNNLENDLHVTTLKMLVWLPLTMSRRVFNHFLNDSNTLYKNMLLISSDAVLIGSVVNDDYDNGYYTLLRSPKEISLARKRADSILERSTTSNAIYNNQNE